MKLQKGALISDKLKRTNVFITDFDYCKEVHNKMGRKIYDSQICAKDPKAKKGPCWVSSLSFLLNLYHHSFS